MNRRQFLVGSALASTALSAGVAFADSAAPETAAEGFDGSAAFSPEAGHAWEIVPEDVPAELITETLDADIVVVGAGTAGMACAQAAAEAGAKVVLVERSDSFSARGHDLGAVNTELQKANGIAMDPLEMRVCWEELTMNKTNLGLFNLWLNHSGEVVDYYVNRMAEDGVECFPGSYAATADSPNPCLKEYPTSHSFGHGQKDENGEYLHHILVRHMEQWAADEGVDIRYNTRVVRLVKDGDAVTGVIGQTDDGYVRVNAPAIVLATGGIGGNTDMLQTWAPIAEACPYKVYIPYGCNTGDGVCLGMWAGAAHQKSNAAPMFLPTSAAQGGPLFNDGGNLCWLAVNTKGERFARENVNGTLQSFAVAKQPGGIGYSVFDGKFADDLLSHVPDGLNRAHMPYVNDQLEQDFADAIDMELLFKADTIEELANLIGAEPAVLQATIDRYNELCAAGVDEDFGKAPQYLTTVVEPPFYASRIKCGMLVTIFGLNCNGHAQVCDAADDPIPGLYAVGNVQGNFFTDSYPIIFPGISHGRCMTIGRVLGQALAAGKEI